MIKGALFLVIGFVDFCEIEGEIYAWLELAIYFPWTIQLFVLIEGIPNYDRSLLILCILEF